VHVRSTEVVGVLPNLPAAQVACEEQVTDLALLCAWNLAPVHSVQLVDVVAKANPAAQKLQLDPVKAPLVWYFPFSQLLQPRLMDALGAVVS